MSYLYLPGLLFPSTPRTFVGQRWLNILLRSVHLMGLAGLAGHFLTAAPVPQIYWYLTLGSGFAMLALYVWSTALWLVQLKGVVILVKLALLLLARDYPAWQSELFLLTILLSSVISHAPGAVRGYCLLGGNRGRGHC